MLQLTWSLTHHFQYVHEIYTDEEIIVQFIGVEEQETTDAEDEYESIDEDP